MTKGVLAQAQLDDSSWTDAYQPSVGEGAVFNLNMANLSSTETTTIRVAMVNDGTGRTTESYIEYDTPIAPYKVFERTGLVVQYGYSLQVYAVDGLVIFATYGTTIPSSSGGVLAQEFLNSTDWFTLYTVPTGKSATFTLAIDNVASSSTTFSFTMGGALGSSSMIEQNTVLPGKGVYERTSLCMSAGQSLYINAADANRLSASVYGFVVNE